MSKATRDMSRDEKVSLLQLGGWVASHRGSWTHERFDEDYDTEQAIEVETALDWAGREARQNWHEGYARGLERGRSPEVGT